VNDAQIALAPSFGPSEARRLTDQVKSDAQALWQKLVELYEGGAWSALNYPSWHEYCATEFGFGRSHSYRLLEAGRVAELVPHGGMNERQARELAPVLREDDEEAVVDLWCELREEYGEQLTAAKVRAAVEKRLKPTRVVADRKASTEAEPARVAPRCSDERARPAALRPGRGQSPWLARLPHLRLEALTARLPGLDLAPSRPAGRNRAEGRAEQADRCSGTLAGRLPRGRRPGLRLARGRSRCDRGDPAMMPALGASAAAEAQRILDRAARRLLEARLDCDAIGAASGSDDCALHNGPNQGTPLIDGQQIPVPGADGDRGRGGGK
jgi:hypothetical protein